MGTISKKICMVGDFGVGKTSLIRRFVEREFSDRYLSTVGVKISRKVIPLTPDLDRNLDTLKLLIWDLEGQTKFKAITPSYLHGSESILVVADVTRQETIDNIQNHIQLFLGINPQGSIAIALNKIDLLDSDEQSYLKESIHSTFTTTVGAYFTSAKTGENVDTIFNAIAQKMVP
ncbi:Rab family GTPase [Spirulina major]|uniref:Rab family GTPase n=1 Tax=Spirulina major TaxID=270636 RepID=UPI0009330D27|nr:Rab family GTPase [Spirulina major]